MADSSLSKLNYFVTLKRANIFFQGDIWSINALSINYSGGLETSLNVDKKKRDKMLKILHDNYHDKLLITVI